MKPIILLCAGAGVALAQSARPAVGPVPQFTPPVVRTEVVNGLRMSLAPYGSTPTARVELVIRSGRASEDVRETGISQLVADYLMEGSTSRRGTEIARELAAIGTVGGALSVNVGTHETAIAGEVLAESAPRLVALIAELALSPGFDSAAFDRLKTNLRRRSQVTAPAAVAALKVNALLFPGDVADLVPTDETLNRLTLADLRRFHGREYVASRARLYVVGVFDPAAVVSAARTAFASIPRGEPAAPLASTRPESIRLDSGTVVHVIDRPNATQSRIHIAFPVVDQMHPDHVVLNQLNILMGSVQTSRIIANVRERRGYSYNIFSRLVRRPGGTSWSIQGDVNRDVTGAALREILGEVDRLQREPPSHDELTGFQRFMSGVSMSEMATSRGILDYLRFLDFYGADVGKYLASLVPNIHAVTAADILRVHSLYLRPERRVIVVIGDAAAIESQLTPWARIVR